MKFFKCDHLNISSWPDFPVVSFVTLSKVVLPSKVAGKIPYSDKGYAERFHGLCSVQHAVQSTCKLPSFSMKFLGVVN